MINWKHYTYYNVTAYYNVKVESKRIHVLHRRAVNILKLYCFTLLGYQCTNHDAATSLNPQSGQYVILSLTSLTSYKPSLSCWTLTSIPSVSQGLIFPCQTYEY